MNTEEVKRQRERASQETEEGVQGRERETTKNDT